MLFRQYDSRWGLKPYPTYKSNFADNGCGACAVAHLLITRKKYAKITPDTVRLYMIQHHHAVPHCGTTHAGITDALKHYGFRVTHIGQSDPMSKVWKKLDKGAKKGIILFNGGSRGGVTWTLGGHYMAFTNYKKENGKHYFYMKDSGPRKHDGWYCYESTMKGLINQVWIAENPVVKKKPTSGTQKTEPIAKKYPGKLPSIRVKKTAEEVAKDAANWAKKIASMNEFHYGEGGKPDKKGTKKYDITHRCGCFFCGTNEWKKVQPANKLKLNGKDWAKTWVCNTFTTAAYAHGGQDADFLKKCKTGSCFGPSKNGKNAGMDKTGKWQNMGKIPVEKLKKGDLLLYPTHVSLCTGKSTKKGYCEVTEACSYDGKYRSKASDNSIRTSIKKPKYDCVYRYKGTINRDIPIELGEYSDRVLMVQEFLDWAGYLPKGTAKNGLWGTKTEQGALKFLKDTGVKSKDFDGKVTWGPKSNKAAKEFKK